MNEEKIKAWFKKNFGNVDKTPSIWALLIAGAIFIWIGVIATWKGIMFVKKRFSKEKIKEKI